MIRECLAQLGYNVRGTTHKASGGHGLVSPHHLGFPHARERFFIVASLATLPEDPFPVRDRHRSTRLADIVQRPRELTLEDASETALSKQQVACIDHWNTLLRRLPRHIELPSFPIWGDEIDASYPFADRTPYSCSLRELVEYVPAARLLPRPTRASVLALLPSYARSEEETFPAWKVQFIRQNRNWLQEVRSYFPKGWVGRLRQFPPSLRKLEWNCKGEERDLWVFVLQFRPSGLRVKRYTSSPALVAMTTTQVPILGPERRFITRTEGLRLQGFPDSHVLPKSRAAAFAALGNAVHVDVAKAIAERLLSRDSASQHRHLAPQRAVVKQHEARNG